ncbi:MAG: DUF3127 domain-containing protein [Bacteroidetes bacterium]|nr:MAG: DUF3127 domain-containing protein [Bacteroidota bacterium]
MSIQSIQGKLIEKFDTVQISDRFKKREFVVEYIDGNPMYPNFILFQLTQDRCDMLDPFEKESMIEVSFNLRGRKWNAPSGETKYFNSLEAWRLQPVQQTAPGMGGENVPPPPPPPEQDAIDVTESDENDLPF